MSTSALSVEPFSLGLTLIPPAPAAPPATLRVGARVTTRCALADVQKNEIAAGARGCVWNINDGTGVITINLDTPACGLALIDAEPADLEVDDDAYLQVKTQVQCFALRLVHGSDVTHVCQGDRGTVLTVEPELNRYKVRLHAQRITACYPMQLVQPVVCTPLVRKLRMPSVVKMVVARMSGKLSAPGTPASMGAAVDETTCAHLQRTPSHSSLAGSPNGRPRGSPTSPAVTFAIHDAPAGAEMEADDVSTVDTMDDHEECGLTSQSSTSSQRSPPLVILARVVTPEQRGGVVDLVSLRPGCASGST